MTASQPAAGLARSSELDQAFDDAGATLADVRAVIPRSAFQRDYRRAFAYLLVAAGSLVGSVAFSALVWARELAWLFPAAWFLTGTSFMALFIIGHDCGHNSFFPSRAWNVRAGHLVFIPLGYAFHAWKYFHDAHHRRTNGLGKTLVDVLRGEMDLRHDTAFVPLTVEEGAALGRASAVLSFAYRLTRTFPPFATWVLPVILLALFHSASAGERRAAAASSVFVIVVGSIVAAGIVWLAGSPWGLVHFWVLPHVVFSIWFGIYAFLQHTAEDVPVFSPEAWAPYRAQFLGSVNCRFPRWVGFWHGDGDLHLPHHIAATIPSYRLREANEALRASKFGPLMKERDFSFAYLFRQLRACHLWDVRRGAYVRFARRRIRGG